MSNRLSEDRFTCSGKRANDMPFFGECSGIAGSCGWGGCDRDVAAIHGHLVAEFLGCMIWVDALDGKDSMAIASPADLRARGLSERTNDA
jgi:hypothetical protein